MAVRLANHESHRDAEFSIRDCEEWRILRHIWIAPVSLVSKYIDDVSRRRSNYLTISPALASANSDLSVGGKSGDITIV